MANEPKPNPGETSEGSVSPSFKKSQREIFSSEKKAEIGYCDPVVKTKDEIARCQDKGR